MDVNLFEDKNSLKKPEVIREPWIDSAKGFGVVLVVLGHLLYDSSIPFINQLIYSFHVPMFFVISGYVQKAYISKDFLKKRFVRLMVPYFLFIIIWIPFYAYDYLKGNLLLKDCFLNAFYVKGVTSNQPLWFLFVLFEISIIIAVTQIPSMSLFRQYVIAIVTFGMSWLVYTTRIQWLNLFGFNRALICTGFYIIGLILAKEHKYVFTTPGIAICMITNVLCGLINGKISVYSFKLGSFILFMLAAVTGSLAIMGLCRKYVNSDNVFARLSKYAIPLLGLQYCVIAPFRKIMNAIGVSGTFVYDIAMLPVVFILLLGVPACYNAIIDKKLL